MKCPNCSKNMTKDFCMYCGYMKTGEFVDYNKKKEISDTELYLGDEYNKILRNETYISTFLFGPLYLCYRRFFIVGIFLGIINYVLFFLITYIGSLIHFTRIFSIIYICCSKIFWMTASNMIYLFCLQKRLNRLKIKLKDKNKYTEIISNNKKNSNILLPFLAIFIYFFILFTIAYIYRIINHTL